jgi:fatty-acyl-CoA synthase
MAGSDFVFPGADLSPRAITGLVITAGITLAAGVPTIWVGAGPLLSGKPHRLRTILCGGSAVPRALAERYRTEIGVPLLQAWGMTEISPLASLVRIRSDRAASNSDEQLADLSGTQGLPVPGVELRIADSSTGEALPWDDTATGEVQIRGPWIAREYYNDTRGAASFTDDGWLRTGDVAAVSPDGYLRLIEDAGGHVRQEGSPRPVP